MPISSALGSSALLPAGLGFRNKIINGGFDIWQRGPTPPYGNDYTADRWLGQLSGMGINWLATRQAFTAGNAISGQEPPYFLRQTVTSAGFDGASTYISFEQRIEDVRTCAGQNMSVSFYAKSNSGTKNLGIDLYQNFGTSGSTSVQGIGAKKVTLTTSWQKFTITTIVPSISGKTVNANSYLALRFWLSAGTDYNAYNGSLGYQETGTFDFWGVQVEQNLQPTPFEQRPIGVELALCQRYYYQSARYGTTFTLGDANPPPIAQYSSAAKIANAWWWYQAQLPVPMRAAPTPYFSDGAGTVGKLMFATDTGGTASNNNSIYTSYSAPTHVIVTVYTQGGYYGVFASVKADAEL